MANKTALIFGVSGQDGAYLANFLLKKKYKVIGLTRNISKKNLFRLEIFKIKKKIKLLKVSEINQNLLNKLFRKYQNIKEIYYLSGETSPLISITKPLQTFQGNVINLITILEFLKIKKTYTKFFYASSSEIFKKNKKNLFDENSEVSPSTPYGISKAAGLWLVKFYREYNNIYACSGVLFNHESPLRSSKFVFKKIIDNSKKIKKTGGKIYLGNIRIKRDVGWAPDYVKAMWKMLQLKKPIDLVIGSGKLYSIKKFLDLTFKNLKISKKKAVINQKKYLRKIENNEFRSNPSLAKRKIKFKNSFNLEKIVIKMINNELY